MTSSCSPWPILARRSGSIDCRRFSRPRARNLPGEPLIARPGWSSWARRRRPARMRPARWSLLVRRRLDGKWIATSAGPGRWRMSRRPGGGRRVRLDQRSRGAQPRHAGSPGGRRAGRRDRCRSRCRNRPGRRRSDHSSADGQPRRISAFVLADRACRPIEARLPCAFHHDGHGRPLRLALCPGHCLGHAREDAATGSCW